jgi:transmembrane sensor
MSRTDEFRVTGGVAEEAAGWFARLQGEAATGDDWQAFERWLVASPANANAYERLEGLWVDLDYAPVTRELGGRPLLAAQRRLAQRRTSRRTWLGAGLAIAAGLVVAAGVGLWPSTGPSSQTYATAPGETRQITLADGSRIRLNAASKITVTLGRHVRQVRMADAEAAFNVAHDAARPFLIAVGDRQVRVVGTEFNLRHRADRVALTVRRGVVEVRPVDAPQGEPMRVTVGQQLTHIEGQVGSILRISDPEAAFAWTSGQLIYRDQPLSEVAADLGRRFAVPVRTADADTAALRFSGVLVTDNEQDVLRRLQAYAPVRVERTSSAIVLYRR